MCADTERACFYNPAAVGIQNAFDDAQAEAEAAGAGGKKRREDARLNVGGDAGAAVLKLNLKKRAPSRQIRQRVRLGRVGAGRANGQRAAVGLKRQRVFQKF